MNSPLMLLTILVLSCTVATSSLQSGSANSSSDQMVHAPSPPLAEVLTGAHGLKEKPATPDCSNGTCAEKYNAKEDVPHVRVPRQSPWAAADRAWAASQAARARADANAAVARNRALVNTNIAQSRARANAARVQAQTQVAAARARSIAQTNSARARAASNAAIARAQANAAAARSRAVYPRYPY